MLAGAVGVFGLRFVVHLRALPRNSSDLDLALSVSSASFRAAIADGLDGFAGRERAHGPPFPRESETHERLQVNRGLVEDYRHVLGRATCAVWGQAVGETYVVRQPNSLDTRLSFVRYTNTPTLPPTPPSILHTTRSISHTLLFVLPPLPRRLGVLGDLEVRCGKCENE